jgi:hypothetical protein
MEERTRKELKAKQSKKSRTNDAQTTGLRRRRSDASTASRSPAVPIARMGSPHYPGPAPPGHFPAEPLAVEPYGSWYPPQTPTVPQTLAPARPTQPTQSIQYQLAVVPLPVNTSTAVVVASEVHKEPSISSSSKRSSRSKMQVDESSAPEKPEKVHGKKRVATDVDVATEYMELDQDNAEEEARSAKRTKRESQATKKEPEATQATTSKPAPRNPTVEQVSRATKRTRGQAASETDTYEPEVARKRLKTETTTELEPLTTTPPHSRKSQAHLVNETTPPTVDDVATTQDQEAATPKTWLEADGCTSTDPLCKSRKVGKMWMNRKWGFRVGMDGLRERLCEITCRRKPSRAIRLVSQTLYLFEF